jgi:biopolymer transport protein ExbB
MGNLSIVELLKSSLAMDVLLVMSVVTVTFAIERLWFFIRTGSNLRSLYGALKGHIERNDGKAALAACEKDGGFLSRVAATVITNANLPRLELDKAVDSAIEQEMVAQEKNLIVLGTMSNIAPLMGLFGTVVGIIRSFREIAVAGSGGSGVIAMGVSEALLTTAVGIVVAVIATVCYNLCIRRIRVRSVQMDEIRQAILLLFAQRRARSAQPTTGAAATSAPVARRAA